jgi:hypothetical protein
MKAMEAEMRELHEDLSDRTRQTVRPTDSARGHYPDRGVPTTGSAGRARRPDQDADRLPAVTSAAIDPSDLRRYRFAISISLTAA